MIKVADINISKDSCGIYIVRLLGNDASFFKIVDNSELWFLLDQPCKSLYTVTVSVQDISGRFSPKNVVYTLNANGCFCTTTTTTTIAPTTTTTTSTTINPVTTFITIRRQPQNDGCLRSPCGVSFYTEASALVNGIGQTTGLLYTWEVSESQDGPWTIASSGLDRKTFGFVVGNRNSRYPSSMYTRCTISLNIGSYTTSQTTNVVSGGYFQA